MTGLRARTAREKRGKLLVNATRSTAAQMAGVAKRVHPKFGKRREYKRSSLIIVSQMTGLKFVLDPAVYPNFDLYPASSVVVSTNGDRQPPRKQAPQSHAKAAVTRPAAPWKHVWPYQHVEDVSRPVQVRLPAAYPAFDICKLVSMIFHVICYSRSHIDPAVYPHFDLYPSSSVVEVKHDVKTSVKRSPPPKKRPPPSTSGTKQVQKTSPCCVFLFPRFADHVESGYTSFSLARS